MNNLLYYGFYFLLWWKNANIRQSSFTRFRNEICPLNFKLSFIKMFLNSSIFINSNKRVFQYCIFNFYAINFLVNVRFRYRSLEATARRRMESTPPPRQPLPSAYSLFEKVPSIYDGISTMEELDPPVEPPLDKLPQSPPCQVRVPANKYSLTYQHHPVSRRRPHVPGPQYEHFSPMHVRTTSKTVCSAKELSQIITEPSGGRYVLPNEGYNEVYPDVFIGDM